MTRSFRELLRSYCLESSIVGLKYLYIYPDWVSRCFWIINLIGMLSLSLSITWLLYSRFQEMPTRITIENQFEPVASLPYPSITICTPKQFSVTALNYFNRSLLDGNRTIDLERVFSKLTGFYERAMDIDESDMKHLEDLLVQNRYSVVQVLGTMPQPCDSFIKRCTFEGKFYADCGELFKPILTKHGLCCTFNSMYIFNGRRNIVDPFFKIHNVSQYGFVNALSVVMDSEPDDAIPGTLMVAGSIRIMYSDCSEFPSDDETILVDPSGESYHPIFATYTYCSEEVAVLPHWSRNCLFGNERTLEFFPEYRKSDCDDMVLCARGTPVLRLLALLLAQRQCRNCLFGNERTLEFFPEYRKSDCDHMCYVLAVHQYCGCWLYFLPNVKGTLCSLTTVSCIGTIKRNMMNWMLDERCDCPRNCVSRQYTSDVVLGNFEALPYTMHQNVLFRDLELNDSSAVMHFFYGSPVYVKQKQETVVSIVNIASNLGGVFGLFMGCSGISVLEVLFYIYLWVRNLIRRRFYQFRRKVAPAQLQGENHTKWLH